MALGKTKKKAPESSGVLDVTASMEGSLVFQEPVQLRISGDFKGTLETKGELTVGEKAIVQADLSGEDITIAGQVTGNIVALRSLTVKAPALIQGKIQTPILEVQPGAQIQGTLDMGDASSIQDTIMSLQEVAAYLEIESTLVEQWAEEGKLQGAQAQGAWQFEKNKIDEWVATQKSS